MSDKNKHIEDKGWSAMSTILDKEMPLPKEERRRRPLFWMWLFGAACVASIAVFALNHGTTSTSTQGIAESSEKINDKSSPLNPVESSYVSTSKEVTTSDEEPKSKETHSVAPKPATGTNIKTSINRETITTQPSIPVTKSTRGSTIIRNTETKNSYTNEKAPVNLTIDDFITTTTKPANQATNLQLTANLGKGTTSKADDNQPTNANKNATSIRQAVRPLIFATLVHPPSALVGSSTTNRSLITPKQIKIQPTKKHNWTKYALAKTTLQSQGIYGGGLGLGLSRNIGAWSVHAEGGITRKLHTKAEDRSIVATVTALGTSVGSPAGDDAFILVNENNDPEATVEFPTRPSLEIMRSTVLDLEIGIGRQIASRWTVRGGIGYQRLLSVKNSELEFVSSDPAFEGRLTSFSIDSDFLNQNSSFSSNLTWNAEVLFDINKRFSISAGYQGLIGSNDSDVLADKFTAGITNNESILDLNGPYSLKSNQQGLVSNRIDLSLMYKF